MTGNYILPLSQGREWSQKITFFSATGRTQHFCSGSDLLLIKGIVEITWQIIRQRQLLVPIMFAVFGLKVK